MKLAVFIALFAIADGVHLNKRTMGLSQVSSRVQQLTYASDFVASDLDSVLSSNKIVVFVKSKCPYCQQVEDLLENDEIDAYIINMDEVSDKKAVKEAVNERSNNSMVPKIFINDKYIGMLSQLKEWEANGKLFKAAGIERPPRDCDAVGGCSKDGEGSEETFPDTEMPPEIEGEAPSDDEGDESEEQSEQSVENEKPEE